MKKFGPTPRMTANIAVFLLRTAWVVLTILTFFVAYKLLLEQIFDGSWQIIYVFFVWIITAYIVIPKIHKVLSHYYLPDYFVGRIRSPHGLLSDPINLAFFGTENNIHSVMKQAGWQKAEKLTPKTFIKTAYCCLFRRSYKNAPVGRMYLFDRIHNFAYQQQVNGSPNERHHIRFWKVPRGWRLPGGYKAEWLAAATYDTHLGIKLATGQIDHYIHEDVDGERDYIIKTIKATGLVEDIVIVKHFTDAFHDRNNGGDRIKTDGSLPFISL